ncbi:hypothetical protein BS329_15415 [Amycolatopsis coloradensis]|uniref:Cupin 2 conserved barrel domain-containing protein n=1 Tax=Amycolatopsis coloradensis TaxID=76021 RepID=A0A1R0KU49_9PSEU|nr:hypothetical protein [Amycolatopsis coloradensis]OLZ51653.1 hypothetical protein BS329_15415 [Amycolatopsis coloradensis]
MAADQNPVPRRSTEEPFHTNVYELPSVLGAQQQILTPAVHSGVAPVRHLSAGSARMPGEYSTQAHEHPDSEIIVFVHRGLAVSLWGEDMTPVLHRPGSVMWIPPGVAHAAVTLNPHRGVAAFEVRSDRTFGDDTVLRPDLDFLVSKRIRDLRSDYALGRLDPQLFVDAGPEREGA